MAFQPVPGVARVSMEYLSGSRTIVNTFHFEYLGSIGIPEMTELGDFMEAWEAEFNQDRRWIGSTFVRCTVLSLDSSISPVVEIIPDTPIPGTQSAEPIANNVAVVTTLKTAQRGRSYRGRTYWGMLTELTVTGDGVNSTQAGLYDSQVEALVLAFPAINWRLSVVSRIQGGEVMPLGVATPVTAWDTRGFVKSQRRRLTT